MKRREFILRVDGAVPNPSSSIHFSQLFVATVATFISLFAIAPVYAFENLPNKNLTGGSVRTGNRDTACGHAKENRARMNAMRRDEILRRYGLPPGIHPDYQIDHLIPLCLGGSDDPSNLWPEPRRSIEETWNAEAKDRLEHLMCRMVCDGQIDIAAAQEAFATDWIAAYHAYYEVENRSKITIAGRRSGGRCNRRRSPG
jgi:hypothetical protein